MKNILKNKIFIIAVVTATILIVAGGIIINAQIRMKNDKIMESNRRAESERIAESEIVAESERIAESEKKEENERLSIVKIESLVKSLYSDESKSFLSDKISKDKITEVETLLIELENIAFSIENSNKIDSLKMEFNITKDMFKVSESMKKLTLEIAITDEGMEKTAEIKKELDALQNKKPEFVESFNRILNTLIGDVEFIKDVEDTIRLLFMDDDYTMVSDDVTIDAFHQAVSLKDRVSLESIRLAFEEKLMVVSNHLNEKVEEVKTADNANVDTTNNNNNAGSGSSST